MIPKELKGQITQKFEVNMIKKPKILKAKYVEKFEYCAYCSSDMEKLLDLREFYTQKFIPEMIEEYFEGWKRDYLEIYDYTNKGNVRGINILRLEKEPCLFELTNDGFPIPTLSDFIDACINSDIRLKWRDK